MAAAVKTFRMSRHMLRSLVVYVSYKRHVALCAGSSLLLKKSHSCSVNGTSKMASNMATSKESIQSQFEWLKDHAPCFGVNGDDITVLNEPVDFCETFKSMARNATKRLIISSLYLGDGAIEEDLVNCIAEACQNAEEGGNDKFEVHILLDYTRGSRGTDKSSRTMLTPLLEKFGDRVHVYLYHTPDLRGWLKRYVPERFNETVGLNHMKVYLADNDLIISGANLSDSYFTNRQDRYIQFRSCPQMADYFSNLIQAFSKFSFHLKADNTTTFPIEAYHPYEGCGVQQFKEFAGQTILKAIQKSKCDSNCDNAVTQTDQSNCDAESVNHAGSDLQLKDSTMCDQRETTHDPLLSKKQYDTWLYPLVQMGPFNITDDETVTTLLFKKSGVNDRILLTSGYFNLTSHYVNVVLQESRASYDILTASPEANGFYGARGIAGFIPDSFTYIAKQFCHQLHMLGQDKRITMYEYYRAHWTFHCKGLWYYLSNSSLPVLTLIGSPNFGYRSVYRDLECQVAIVTTNPSLQQQLQSEQERLYGSSTVVTMKTYETKQRYVALWVRIATQLIKHML